MGHYLASTSVQVIVLTLTVIATVHPTTDGCQNQNANHIVYINTNGDSEAIGQLEEEFRSLEEKFKVIEDWLPQGVPRVTNGTQTVHQTCQSWYTAGVNQSGYMMVDPDGLGGEEPFRAYCNMSRITQGHGIPTEIHHDSMGKTKINSKCQDAKCFSQNINYMASKRQILALIHSSRSCSQFIGYDCFNSVLFQVAHHYGAWYSRDGHEMSYWGGAPPGTDKCACGVSNSCATSGKRCNCDSNDAVWRADYGYLRDKKTIPVSMLKFGDLDRPSEKAFYTLGPLVCY